MRTIILLILSCLSALAAPTSQAEDHTEIFLSTGIAAWGVLDSADRYALHLGLEMRPASGCCYQLQPAALAIIGQSDSHYFGVGLFKDFAISPRWSAGLGIYVGSLAGSKAVDRLGDSFEFYSRLFLTYELKKAARIRLEFGHISNAGQGDTNPGSESFVISYLWPLN